jgi:Spy/CpxP family protein refolding chaperone
MLKQSLLVLVAAGLISIAAPFAAAQDSPSNDRQSNDRQSNDQQSQPSQEVHRHHGPDPAERTQELTRHLKLTSDQQTKVKDALQSEHSQMESLHQDSSLSREDRRAKMMDVRKGTDAQIRELLDSTQQKKWDEIQAKRAEWMQHRHQGPDSGSDPQSKPPQQ